MRGVRGRGGGGMSLWVTNGSRVVTALGSLIKPLFNSFEFASESSAIKSHLL